ncbi:hypothetical protein ACFO4L_11105 [Bacillus daqingensis]|uniref:DUF4013 domain-containing protein n=1 Tax=Bacillus daqingensis TaxID=872396 RepID=A0ABV9NW66_9BACI
MPKLLSVSELITETFRCIKQPGWWAPTFLALIAVSLPVWIFLLISDQPFLYGEGRELSLGELNQTGGANDHPFRGGGETFVLFEQIFYIVVLPGIYAFLILRLLFPKRESKQLCKIAGKRIGPLLIANVLFGIILAVILLLPVLLGLAGGPGFALFLLVLTFLIVLIGFVRFSFYYILVVLTGSTPQFNPAYHLMAGHTGKAILFFLLLGLPGYGLIFGAELILLSIFGYSVLAEILYTFMTILLSIVLVTVLTVLFRNVYRWEEEKEPELST